MSSNNSKLNNSFGGFRNREFSSETELQRLQRDADNFTRLLEQEKRRLFTVEEQFQSTLRDFKDWGRKTEKVHTPSKLEKQTLSVKIHSLEKQLEQAIVKYNEILASNRLLRADVDVIRRERNTMAHVRKNMTEKLEKATTEYEDISRRFKLRLQKTQEAKDKILDIREKNKDQQNMYKTNYQMIQTEYKRTEQERRPLSYNRHQKIKEKYESFDTQNIMRRRLQRIILNNKEKVNVISQYQTNMKMIDEAFNIIKETSGITDIEEIMNTFIKSEEQNYSLFNYVNILTQDIDFLEENNKDLEEEIKNMELAIEQKRIINQQTPQEEIDRQKLEAVVKDKEVKTKEVRRELDGMQKSLENCLKKVLVSKFCPEHNLILYDDFVFNENTADQYLEVLEASVDKMIPFISRIHENRDFLLTGLLLEEMPNKDFNKSRAQSLPRETAADDSTYDNTRFLDESFFRQMAEDSVIRHKNNNSFISNFTSGTITQKLDAKKNNERK